MLDDVDEFEPAWMGIQNPHLRALAEKYHRLTVPAPAVFEIENPNLRKLVEKYRTWKGEGL